MVVDKVDVGDGGAVVNGTNRSIGSSESSAEVGVGSNSGPCGLCCGLVDVSSIQMKGPGVVMETILSVVSVAVSVDVVVIGVNVVVRVVLEVVMVVEGKIVVTSGVVGNAVAA